ncbi:DMT family transporter [Oceaniglobus trochenteri]|uniref:DMT family transporter n=1 Tax=Oceaniglobus trochenteri TaxID=2763260 RepID=UPI001CFF752C|nr:DMT family transporter [Oceaniglobus trochenteri]
MDERRNMDAFGAAWLIGFSLLLAFNQVVIKVTNDGLQPVFAAGIRSLGATLCLLAWMRWRGIAVQIAPGSVRAGLALGMFFSLEFVFLFTALDLTTVTRTSVIFYTMPVWLTLAAHFLLPGERLSRLKLAGLALAFAGVVLALSSRAPGGESSLVGDLCALAAALCWAGIALAARARGMQGVRPEMQLLWQTVISAVVLLVAAPAFGPLLRALAPIHVIGMGFQIVVVATAGFLMWLWLLGQYRAGQVAAFGFLAPVFGAFMGWALLDEPLGLPLFAALALVVCGLALINRPAGGFRFRRKSA